MAQKSPSEGKLALLTILIIAGVLAVAALPTVVTFATRGEEKPPLTSGEVVKMYHLPAQEGGRSCGGLCVKGEREAEWKIVVENGELDQRRMLWLSQGLYEELAMGDALTLAPDGLILSVNGAPR